LTEESHCIVEKRWNDVQKIHHDDHPSKLIMFRPPGQMIICVEEKSPKAAETAAFL